MAASLDEAAGNTDSLRDTISNASKRLTGSARPRLVVCPDSPTHRALASDDRHRRVLRKYPSAQRPPLHAGGEGDSATGVAARPVPALDELDILKNVGIDDDGASARAAADEVMTHVANDQSEVISRAKSMTALMRVFLVVARMEMPW